MCVCARERERERMSIRNTTRRSKVQTYTIDFVVEGESEEESGQHS